LEGSYTYHAKHDVIGFKPEYDLFLRGTIDAAGTVSLDESAITADGKPGAKTGHIDGALTADGSISGTWKAPDGKRTGPVAWKTKMTLGKPGAVTVLISNIGVTGTEPPAGPMHPVGGMAAVGDVVLVDRRRETVVKAIERGKSLIVAGACSGLGQPVENYDKDAGAARFSTSFKGEKIIAMDAADVDCQRMFSIVLVSVTTAAGPKLHVRGFQGTNDVDFTTKPVFDVTL
jgi:hypothetical protein